MGTTARTHYVYTTVIGPLTIAANGTAITHVLFGAPDLPGSAHDFFAHQRGRPEKNRGGPL